MTGLTLLNQDTEKTVYNLFLIFFIKPNYSCLLLLLKRLDDFYVIMGSNNQLVEVRSV